MTNSEHAKCIQGRISHVKQTILTTIDHNRQSDAVWSRYCENVILLYAFNVNVGNTFFAIMYEDDSHYYYYHDAK